MTAPSKRGSQGRCRAAATNKQSDKLKFAMPGLGGRLDLAYFPWKKHQNTKKVIDLLAFLGYNATE